MTETPCAEPMPWPGLEGFGQGAALLSWAWALERLQAARNYWLASSHADGWAHLRAVWAVWVDGGLTFSTGRPTRKARNLAADPRCSLGIEAEGGDTLVVEGVAGEVSDEAAIERADAAYVAKYGSSVRVGDSPIIAVRPRLVIAFSESGGTAVRPTRWRF